MTESSFRTTPSTISLTDLSIALVHSEASLKQHPKGNYDKNLIVLPRWELALLLAAAKEFRSTQRFLDNCLIELLQGALAE